MGEERFDPLGVSNELSRPCHWSFVCSNFTPPPPRPSLISSLDPLARRKVKKWNEQPPIMYSVRMRSSATNALNGGGSLRKPLHSSFTVGRIDLDEDQLGSERVLLVDDRNGHVYLWCGNMSTFKHRGFGLEAATRLKADNPKGGQVRIKSFLKNGRLSGESRREVAGGGSENSDLLGVCA